uniref:Ig-like domain-containing protein n=1 Tax=Hucho hucho TaxID=62062 RepID=A0A4W5KU20_9TELE
MGSALELKRRLPAPLVQEKTIYCSEGKTPQSPSHGSRPPENARLTFEDIEVSDVQYGRLGSNVTLLCRDARDRTSVEWRLNRSSVLPWQHRVTSDGHLVLVLAGHAAEGNYSCHDEQGLLIQTTRLRLGCMSSLSLLPFTLPSILPLSPLSSPLPSILP